MNVKHRNVINKPQKRETHHGSPSTMRWFAQKTDFTFTLRLPEQPEWWMNESRSIWYLRSASLIKTFLTLKMPVSITWRMGSAQISWPNTSVKASKWLNCNLKHSVSVTSKHQDNKTGSDRLEKKSQHFTKNLSRLRCGEVMREASNLATSCQSGASNTKHHLCKNLQKNKVCGVQTDAGAPKMSPETHVSHRWSLSISQHASAPDAPSGRLHSATPNQDRRQTLATRWHTRPQTSDRNQVMPGLIWICVCVNREVTDTISQRGGGDVMRHTGDAWLMQ